MKTVAVLTLLFVFKLVTSRPLFMQPPVSIQPMKEEPQVDLPLILPVSPPAVEGNTMQEQSEVENKLTLCKQELAEIKIISKIYGFVNTTNFNLFDLEARVLELVEAKIEIDVLLSSLAQQRAQMKSEPPDGNENAYFSTQSILMKNDENFENLDYTTKGSDPELEGSTSYETESGCSGKPKGKHIVTYLFISLIIHILME